MSIVVEYLSNKASETEIAEHLSRCDADFIPPLSGRVEINNYAKKIIDNAARFEAWFGNRLIGLVAAYFNDEEGHIAYITSVSILNEWVGKGISEILMTKCIEHAKAAGILVISLEVACSNKPAINLYEKTGFIAIKTIAQRILMSLYLY